VRRGYSLDFAPPRRVMERPNSAVVVLHGLAESQIKSGVPFGVLDALFAVAALTAMPRFSVHRSRRFSGRPDCTRQASPSGSAAPERVGQFCKLSLRCKFHANKVLLLLRRTYTDPGLTFRPIYRGRSASQPKVMGRLAHQPWHRHRGPNQSGLPGVRPRHRVLFLSHEPRSQQSTHQPDSDSP